MPNVNGLYLIVILFNIAGFLAGGWMIMKRLSSDKERLVLYALAWLILVCALPFADVIAYKGHFALFAGPLILAAYYFCMRKKAVMFVLTGLALCAISEDIAMFMCSFSAYLFIFEKDMRKTAFFMGAVSLSYLVVTFFVIQPACQSGLTLTFPSVVAARLSANHGSTYYHGVFVIALYFIRIAAAFIIMALFSGLGKWIKWEKPVGMIIVAPASHWFLVLTEGPGHHYIPVLACTFIAILLVASRLKLRPVAAWRIWAAVIICSAMLIISSYKMIRRCPHLAAAESAARMRTNGEVLRAVKALPEGAGVSYWTNRGLDAFISGRNNAWRFPEYFDSADYLVIQKDADQTFFDMKPQGDIGAAVKDGRYYTGTDIVMPQRSVRSIEDELVKIKASHVVDADTGHVLILKRKNSAGLPNPAATSGFGWIEKIGRL
jgi:uncharacterized membrane protein